MIFIVYSLVEKDQTGREREGGGGMGDEENAKMLWKMSVERKNLCSTRTSRCDMFA